MDLRASCVARTRLDLQVFPYYRVKRSIRSADPMAEGPVQNNRTQESEAVYERLFESSPNAILLTDSAGRITRANPQVEHYFGYSVSELLGHPVELLIPERFRQIHPTHRATFG